MLLVMLSFASLVVYAILSRLLGSWDQESAYHYHCHLFAVVQ